MRETCENCKHWGKRADLRFQGNCKHSPPVPMLTPGAGIRNHYPAMHAEDSCGQFTPRPPARATGAPMWCGTCEHHGDDYYNVCTYPGYLAAVTDCVTGEVRRGQRTECGKHNFDGLCPHHTGRKGEGDVEETNG